MAQVIMIGWTSRNLCFRREGVTVVRKRFATEGCLLCRQAETLRGRSIASIAITPEPLTFITEIHEWLGAKIALDQCLRARTPHSTAHAWI